MKKILIALLLSSFFLSSFSQDLSYEIRGKYARAVKKENLYGAKLIRDFITGYPANWVTDYISVEILATSNGKTISAFSTNETLTTAQQNILNKAELGTEIGVNVKYKSVNSVTDKVENSSLDILMTVVPETEAEYIGGYQQLKKYLKENVINKIAATTPAQYQEGKVLFTINESGEIANAQISKTSGDIDTDNLLLETINKMPIWKPAVNEKGIKVKQQFEFSVGKAGC